MQPDHILAFHILTAISEDPDRRSSLAYVASQVPNKDPNDIRVEISRLVNAGALCKFFRADGMPEYGVTIAAQHQLRIARHAINRLFHECARAITIHGGAQ